MASNLFDQLAELEVPPPPAQFDTQLHDRVNRSLVTWQLVDLWVRAFPWAVGRFARAVLGAAIFTMTGKYDSSKGSQRR